MNILTLGTFDLPHTGHFNLLKRAKALGTRLIVAINTDEFVKSFKGKNPVMSIDQRASILENCKYVDAVIVSDGAGYNTIIKINPDFIVIGSDYLSKDYRKQLGIPLNEWNYWKQKVLYIPYTDGISTTEIKRRLNA
jgi:glycerol-3-phosphate cytidylyltransferase